jgi:hypothetical protein
MASKIEASPSQLLRGLKRRSATARLLRLGVRIPPRARMSLSCECCVLSGKGVFEELIARPEESYQLCWVVCDLDTSRMRRPWPGRGRSAVWYKEAEEKAERGFFFGLNRDVMTWRCDVGWSYPDISKERRVSILRVKQSKSSKFETKSYRRFVHYEIRMPIKIIFESFYISLLSLSDNVWSYHSVIIQLSFSYHSVIIQLSFSNHSVIIQLSFSYHSVIIFTMCLYLW